MRRRSFIKGAALTTAGIIVTPAVPVLAELWTAPAVSATKKGKPLIHYWSKCVGAGRANEGLRAGWLDQLKLVKENCGFEYCRFHGLFHDDMFVYRESPDGLPTYNWQYIDDLFDRMIDIGIRPFVELSFMPKALASTPNTTFWWKANSSPPKDYEKWSLLVSAFTKHCVDRYGLDEVRKWYFEVWNEPNLHGFWDGTKSQYFELYKASVNAIKTVDKQLKVGGPSTSNFVPDERFDGEVEDKAKQKTFTVKDLNTLTWRAVWLKDFLRYCSNEKLVVDFVSTHPYPTDWAIDPETKKGGGRVRRVTATAEDLKWLRDTINNSAYPNTEIHCTEWSSSPSPRDPTHDSLQAATYIIKANLDGIGYVDSLSYWTFTDVFEESGAGPSIFHGGFGMINYQGIVKPSFHAYRMLNALGDQLLLQEEDKVITRHSSTNKITALLYHYPREVNDVVSGAVEGLLNKGTSKEFQLEVKNLAPGSLFQIEALNRDYGFAYMKWKEMGSPESPSRKQISDLITDGMATEKLQVKAQNNGILNWKRVLQPWECVLVTEV